MLAFDPPVNHRLLDSFLAGTSAVEAITALALQPRANKASFLKILDDPNSSKDIWLGALSALGATDQPQSEAYVVSRLKEQPGDAPVLIATLGRSKPGTVTLLALLASQLILPADISPAIADRVFAIHPKNPVAISLAKTANQQREEEKQAAMKRLPGPQGTDRKTKR